MTDQSTFEGWVEQIKRYILAGDVMQVVPAQRMSVPFDRAPLTLYRALRNLNPSPYLYFIDWERLRLLARRRRFWFVWRAARSRCDP